MKNLISNILGIFVIFAAVFGVLKLELDIPSAAFLVFVGACFFYFENTAIKKHLRKIIKKYI